MPLQKQLLEVPLSSGLNQKSNVRDLRMDGAAVMQNAVVLKNGAIRKRFGHTAISKITSTSPNIGQGAYGDSIAGRMWGIFGGTNGFDSPRFIYQFSDQTAKWTYLCPMPEVQVNDRVGLLSATQNVIDFDIALGSNGLLVCVALTADSTGVLGLFWTLLDMSASSPNASLVQPITNAGISFTTGGIAPKLAACGNNVILSYVVNSTTVNVQSLDLTNPSAGWSAQTAVTLSGGQGAGLGTGVYDLAPVTGDPTRFALAYEKSAGSSMSLAIYSSTAPFTQSTLVSWETQATFNTMASIGLFATSGDRYWVAYTAKAGAGVVAGSPVVRVNNWNESGPTLGTPVTAFTYASGITPGFVSMGITANSTSRATVLGCTGYANGTTAMNNAFIFQQPIIDSAGVMGLGGAGGQCTFGVQLGSKPINTTALGTSNLYNEQAFAWTYLPSSLQGSYYLGGFPQWNGLGSAPHARPVASVATRLSKQRANPLTSGGSFTLPNVQLLTSTPSGNVLLGAMTLSTSTFHSGIYLQSVDLIPAAAWRAATLGSEQLITAGIPSTWDGQLVSEVNFLSYPELAAPTPSGAGGSMATGTYQYVACYEYRDSQGQLHQSAGSVPVSANVTGPSGSVALVIPAVWSVKTASLNFTGLIAGFQAGSAGIGLYRTTANGSLFYRVNSDPPTGAMGTATALTQNTVAFTDTISDATLTAASTAQLLYTTGGVLDNFSPPAARCITSHMGRWWLAGGDDPTQVWPSGALISGIIPGFNEAIAFNATGAVRALTSLDDKLIIFVQRGTAYGIEFVTGQGPTNLGTQSDWTQPNQVESDSGAVDQRGTCKGPFGVLYRSTVGGPNGTGGIFVLGRDLMVRYLSGPVEDTLAANPVVTSMVLHPNNGRVYITCAPGDFSLNTGVRLVWDYNNGGVWSVDNMFDVDSSFTSIATRAAWVANNSSGVLAYHWTTSGGRVYRETVGVGTNSYTDAGHWVTMSFKSAQLKPQQSGFARFWKMLFQSDSLDPSDLNVTLTFDGAPSSYYNETHLFTSGQQAAFDRFPIVDVMMHIGNQKAKSVQVTLSDAPPTGGPTATTGQGPSWATISLELGVKPGGYRNIPPAQSA